MDLKIALIDLCESCGKIRKNSEWKHRDLKKLMQNARVEGFKVEFREGVWCPDCAPLHLPVIAANAPMAVFKQAHQLPL